MTAASSTTIQQTKIVQSSAASTSSANAAKNLAKNLAKNFNSKLDTLTKSYHQATSSSSQMSLLQHQQQQPEMPNIED